MNRDRGVGIFTSLLGIAVAIMTSQLPASTMAGDIGPKVFPYISSGLLIICGLILVLRKPGKPAKPFLVGEEKKRFLAIIGVIILYIAAMWVAGFVIPTILMLTVLSLMFGKDVKLPIWKALIYAVIITVVIYAIFSLALHLRLPVGKLIQF